MTKIAEALKRVLVRPDPAQDEAVINEIDRSGGADVFTVVYNPELVDEQGLTGYKIRAAIASSLEGLARYNRQVKVKHGAYDSDELVFAQGYERAMAELEELVHIAPRATPTPAQAKAQLKVWLQDDKLRAALAPLFETGGDEGGATDADPEAPGAGSPEEDSAQGSSKRARRGAS